MLLVSYERNHCQGQYQEVFPLCIKDKNKNKEVLEGSIQNWNNKLLKVEMEAYKIFKGQFLKVKWKLKRFWRTLQSEREVD